VNKNGKQKNIPHKLDGQLNMKETKDSRGRERRRNGWKKGEQNSEMKAKGYINKDRRVEEARCECSPA